tara:strand:+ start:34 stop:300 length:267 start_codon:yes stop_codon:yes gene_type:complete
LRRNQSHDLIKRENKPCGQKWGQNLNNKYLKKSSDKTGEGWNPIFLLKRNSQSSQKHKKGLTLVSPSSSDGNRLSTLLIQSIDELIKN